MSIVIGVDPDSNKHGIAIYNDGKLIALEQKSLIQIISELQDGKLCNALWVVENVAGNNFIYARNNKSGAVGQNIAQKVGMVKQAQKELTRALEHFGVKFELVKPARGNWAKKKDVFERLTGWAGRSNEDTRAAAFFGYMYRDAKCNTK